MQSLEYKAELRDPEIAEAVCRNLRCIHVAKVRSVDTYYRVPDGRLKRRQAEGEPVEWVFYHRNDRTRPKLSQFTVYSEAQALARFGATPPPVWVVVERTRDIWLKDWVRINIDFVKRLGMFIEFETLVSKQRSADACRRAIRDLIPRFQPAMGEPLSTSYADLLALEDDPGAARAAS